MTMTDDMMNLRNLGEKTPDADILLEMISFAAEKALTAGGRHPGRLDPFGGRSRQGHVDECTYNGLVPVT
jgi:putative transposase